MFSSYESIFFLCEFFTKFVESDQLIYGEYTLNEQIPWSWDTIQGGHNNLSFFYILFAASSCSLILETLVKGLHGLWVLYLHIL